MARYSKEQIDAVIDAAVEALGLESLKHQQREAIHVVSGQDVFVARLEVILFCSVRYSLILLIHSL